MDSKVIENKLKYQNTEAEEQTFLFEWAKLNEGKYPCLKLLFHIPNGGSRNKLEAFRLKKQGVKPGVPDLFLPFPTGIYHGLFIELKRLDGGRLSQYQVNMLTALAKQGYKCLVCNGWEEAQQEIERYINEP